MAPAISPQALAQPAYTVTDSKGMIIDLLLDIPLASPFPGFDLTFPTAAPGMVVKLVRSGMELDLLPGPISTNHAGRMIDTANSTVGANTNVHCEISGGIANNEPWSVKVFSTAPQTYSITDTASGNLEITRVLCDPIAAFTSPPPPTAQEKTSVSLTASLATGPSMGVNIFQTAVGTPQPNVLYKWSLVSPTPIAVNGFPGCDASQNFTFDTPGVYGNRNISFKLDVWFDGTCPNTPGFLENSTAPHVLTIQPRPQYLMFVLDRSGSMFGSRWENAKTGARILTNLFAALRMNVLPSDRVGLLVFEDNTCNWHTPTIDSLVAAVQPLADPATVDNLICALNLGPAGACTPIGDGLYKAMELMSTLPAGPPLPKYTIILLTDGYENSGTIRVNPSTSVPVLSPPVRNFSAARGDFATVNNNLTIFAIGLGSTVQEDVLNNLPLPMGAGPSGLYRHVTDVNQLREAIAQMVSFSQEAQAVVPLAVVPSDPGAVVGHMPQHVYFQLDPKVNRLALAIEWPTDGTNTITLQKRDGVGAVFSGPFTNVTAQVFRNCPQHGFATVELPPLYTVAGDEESVPSTQWRILHSNNTGPQTIAPTDLMIFVDLHVKVDIVFDKQQYRTGDQMVITARVRAGDQLVTGALITVEMARPGVSLGTFLATNAPRYKPGSPTGTDPDHPKAAMINGVLKLNEMQELPVLRPPGFFVDGTDRLFDDGAHSDGVKNDGDYANVYANLDQEGTYTWRFFVEGQLADGSPFNRLLTISKWVGIKVSDATSQFKDEPFRGDVPRGFVGRLVSVLPLDRNKQFLGPFRADEIRFKTTSGAFQGPVESRLDGWYSRVLIHPEGETPQISVIVQGVNIAPHTPTTITGPPDTKDGCLLRIPILGAILRFLKRLLQ